MRHMKSSGKIHRVLFCILFLCATIRAVAQSGPDLTTTNLASINTTYNYSLGPTGLRGWIYIPYPGGDAQNAIASQELMTSFAPYQVLVTAVGTNTPAAGIIQTNDVLLGVNTGLNNLPVALFTNDTRKSIGWAIGAAEAGDGWMNFKIWRAGVTNDVSIRLPLRGLAYSATAPYNCPKSAVILSNAFNIISNRTFTVGTPGNQILGLALLASGNTNFFPKVQAYARSIPMPVSAAQAVAFGQLGMWDCGYDLIFLSEYYLKTGDTNVLPQIAAYALDGAQCTDRYGTVGHSPAVFNADGSFNGTSQGYGPVNQVGLAVDLGLVLGRKAMLAAGMTVDPLIDAGITRGNGFFGWYVQKGNLPYGEHTPWLYHAGNGKEALAALLFALQGNMPVQAEYWTRMTVAGYTGREYGHTGQGFPYLWGGPGANLGGTNAMAAYVQQIQWHLDLERRCDGSFVYDGGEQYGASPVSDYWLVGGNNSYNGIDPTASYVLTYATSLQQLYITGKNPTNTLSSAAVTNAIWAGTFDRLASTYDTNTLIAALGEYDALVRNWAAIELAKRPGVSVANMITLAGSTNAWLRASACTVLGGLANVSALPVLGQCLTDPDDGVRQNAALALQKFGINASTQVPNMLAAFVTNFTNPKNIDWSDPVQIANGQLAVALFGDYVGSSGTAAAATATNARSLLYPALRAALASPDSLPRADAGGFIKTHFSLADVQALAPEIIQSAQTESLADRMWSGDGRTYAITTLVNFKCLEAIPTALSMLNVGPGMGWGSGGYLTTAVNALPVFGDSVRWTLPVISSYRNIWNAGDPQLAALNIAIPSITAATNTPAAVTNLYPVAFSQVVNTTNAVAITLTGSSCRTNVLGFLNLTAPAHGTLTGTAPNLTYTPNAAYVGLDSFTFQVADGMTNSGSATVSLIVGTPAGAGLQGQYFDNQDFSNLKFTRIDPQINFDWGTGTPSNTIAAGSYSVRWTGVLLAPESGNYMFSTLNSDGVRLYVNGNLMIDDWVDQTRQWTDGSSVYLTGGQPYVVQMDYYKNSGSGVAKLKWTGPSFAGSNGVLIAQQWLYNTAAGFTNLPVFAYPQGFTILQNSNAVITLGGSGNATSFAIFSPPSHGSLSGTPPAVTYTPAPNYAGTDSFTFTASNGTSNSAPATISLSILAGAPLAFNWTNTAGGLWSTALNWTNSLGGSVAPNTAGQPFYYLQFNNAGTYTATNDLNSGFAVNQLNFAGTVTLAGNSLNLAGNGPVLPQINQNSANAVVINPLLNLAATTTLGGTGGGSVTIGSSITGAGGLVVNNPGTLNLVSIANDYSGDTVLNAGNVQQLTADGGASTLLLGTGTITINPAATVSLNRSLLTNRIIWNGGTVTGGNGFGDSINGPVTVTGVGTVNFSYTGKLVINGNVTGTGGLTTVGAGPLYLSGTNSYTGLTTIAAGFIKYNVAAAVAPGILSINNGAVANLNYSGTRTNSWLILNGVDQSAGVYGSTNSTATFKSAYFSGTGTLTVAAAMGSISNKPPTNVTTANAVLNATFNGNGVPCTVVAYWGTNSAGANAAAWGNSAVIGSWNIQGATNLSCPIAGLIPNTQYYFTFSATNGIQSLWATNILSFMTSIPTPPVASSFSMGALSGTPVTIQIIGGKYAPTDAAGYPLIVSAVQNSSTRGGTVTTDETNVTYTALNTFTGTDSFTYSVSDNYGGTSTATITVNVGTNGGGYNLISGPVNNGNGTSTINFAGIPGYSYALETTPSLTLPITWTPVQTNTAASNGSLSFTFSTSAGQGYFRTHSVAN